MYFITLTTEQSKKKPFIARVYHLIIQTINVLITLAINTLSGH